MSNLHFKKTSYKKLRKLKSKESKASDTQRNSKDLGTNNRMNSLESWFKQKEPNSGHIFPPIFNKDVASNAEKDGTII
jgi:ribosomal protein L9